MAKKTKDSNLSIEEKLEQALIPNWDEPYKLPENWCWTNLGTLCKIINGFAFKSNKFSDTNGTPVIRITNIKDGYIDIENSVFTIEEDIDEKFVVCQGDLLIAMSGATTGKNGIYRENKRAFLNQRVGNIKIINTNALAPEFRNYYIAYMQDEILKSAYGGAQPNISSEKICQFPIALPPLAEQKRISNLLEKLFAKLEEAEEKAQEIVDGFETCKAAILHKAFSGELTAKWREENGEKYSDWKFSMLGNHLYPMRTKKPSGEVFRYIDIDSIDNINQCVREPKIISVKEAPSRASRAVKIGSVLFSMVRPYLKNIALISEDLTDCIASTGFYVCDCKTDLLPQYLYELLRSDDAINYLMQFMKGDNSPSIRKDDLLEMVIAMPSILEQMEIVRILKELISKEQQAKESAASVIEQIDTMKKAILARAFRGELGTNDSSEESAVELLKKVLGGDAAVQTPAKKPTKRILIPSDIKELLSNIREEEIIKLLLKSAPHPVSIQEIMSLSSKKFELMDALRALEKKQLITKNESGEYSLTR